MGEVRLEIDSRVHFEDADHNAYNIFADLPGRDSRAGFVMAGAHLEDLRQAAVILATVLLDAANSEVPLPGMPIPSQPRLTDPFHYPEPSKP